MELRGVNIRLRPLTVKDLCKMVNWNCDSEVQYYVDCNLPDNLIELERWYSENVPDRNYQIYGIETVDGKLIGDLELDHICWSKREAELRIRIGEKSYWGKGLGTEALNLFLEFVFEKKRLKRVYLRVYHFNERAIRCYLKNGFKQKGILQRQSHSWKDIVLMEVDAVSFRKIAKSKLAG
ncbi:MAG TPA: GNAT family N-acetyltransferase [Bacillota bacterium]|jgi:diamine N-acetyltransferase|nr:GNAT family N-acetyltransferase [Bacillota bacterium]HOL09455.1 GNAT family N-acetyltransferase [Bacillota bacterium]HPO97677.1 GNAT family N-acetyltransferase [Bacillota bacterium]